MSKKRSSSLGVDWFLPGKKRRFATTTMASSMLIQLLAEEGHTFESSLKEIRWDADALTVAQHFCNNGYGNTMMRELVRIDDSV